MRFSIRHETIYHYGTHVQYSIQQIRQTPSNTPSQFVIRWNIDAPNKLVLSYDTYGNPLHTLVLTRPHREIVLLVEGEIETVPLQDGRLLEGAGPIPLPHFTCQTRLSTPNAALDALGHECGPLETAADLIRLASVIGSRVEYRTGITEVTSTAVEALELGHGVCQDHAHLMLPFLRRPGLPALLCQWLSGRRRRAGCGQPRVGRRLAGGLGLGFGRCFARVFCQRKILPGRGRSRLRNGGAGAWDAGRRR